jgi:hypothetical protein
MATLEESAARIVNDIESLAVAFIAQKWLEVIMHFKVVGAVFTMLVYDAAVAPLIKTPFLYQAYCGVAPPNEGLALKVTGLIAHAGLVPLVNAKVTVGTIGLKIILI